MQCGFAVRLFPFSLWSVSHSEMRLHSVHFYFFHFCIFTVSDIVLAPAFRKTFTTWVCFLFSPFCSLLFSLFTKTSHVPPKPSFLIHSPKQKTVHSCPSLQMQVTARSPMVCEQVVPPAPLPSSANEWIPITWYSYDDASDGPIHLKCLSVSWPSVWRWLLTFHILPSCVVLCSFFILFTNLCFISLWWKFKYDLLVTEYEHIQTHF